MVDQAAGAGQDSRSRGVPSSRPASWLIMGQDGIRVVWLDAIKVCPCQSWAGRAAVLTLGFTTRGGGATKRGKRLLQRNVPRTPQDEPVLWHGAPTTGMDVDMFRSEERYWSAEDNRPHLASACVSTKSGTNPQHNFQHHAEQGRQLRQNRPGSSPGATYYVHSRSRETRGPDEKSQWLGSVGPSPVVQPGGGEVSCVTARDKQESNRILLSGGASLDPTEVAADAVGRKTACGSKTVKFPSFAQGEGSPTTR